MNGPLIPRPPYEWRRVREVVHHGRDLTHRNTWLSFELECGHSKEAEKRTRLQRRVRCYECRRQTGERNGNES